MSLNKEQMDRLAELVHDDHGAADVMRRMLVSIFYGKGFRIQEVKILDNENFALMIDLLKYEHQVKAWPQEVVRLAEEARKMVRATERD